MIGAKCRFDTEIPFVKRHGTIISKDEYKNQNYFLIKVESEDNDSFMLLSQSSVLQDKYKLIEKYGDIRIAFRRREYIEIGKMFPNLDIFKKLYPQGELINNYWVVL